MDAQKAATEQREHSSTKTRVEESSQTEQTEQTAHSSASTNTVDSRLLMSELEAAGIIPEVLDSFNPSAQLNLVFATQKGTLQIANGERYASADLSNSPKLTIHESYVEVDSHLYTVALIDLDAPNPTDPLDREYLHWLVTNIPGPQAIGDPALVDPADVGKVVASYEPVNPQGNVPHRYAFVLFRQRPGSVLDIHFTESRRRFKTRDFLESSAVAAPVSAGYFTSSH